MNCFRPKVHFLSIMTDKRLISIQGFDFSKWSLQIWCVKLKVLSGANWNVKDLRCTIYIVMIYRKLAYLASSFFTKRTTPLALPCVF